MEGRGYLPSIFLMDIQLQEMETFKQPGRGPWPWLIVVGVVVVGAFLSLSGSRTRPSPSDEKDKAADVSLSNALTNASPRATPAPLVEASPTRSTDVARTKRRADALAKKERMLEARSLYLKVLGQTQNAALRRDVETRLAAVNIELVTNPWPMPEKVDYSVKPGDELRKLVREYGTTKELLLRMNPQIKNPNVIMTGDRVRIFKGSFSLEVDTKQHKLLVKMNGEFFKRYPVGTGRYDRTPKGTFKITDREKEPVWWRQGKPISFTGDPKGENILGTRWMEIQATGDTPAAKGYGIHGTWQPESVGMASSMGCIRMHNADVEELYDLLPAGTPVAIR